MRFIRAVEAALELLPVRLVLFLALAALMASEALSAPLHSGNTLDWQFFEFFDEIARKTILQFHEIPLWNPYFCGGTTLIGNPQTTFMVPTFPLILLFGTPLGERLSTLAVVIVSAEGGYRLLRHLRATPLAALLGAVSWAFYGRTYGWLHYGQYGLQGTTLGAWVLYGYLKGLERPIYLALGGLFLGWEISFRGIQPGPQLAMALGLWAAAETVVRALRRQGRRQIAWPLGALGILGLAAFGFSSLRMIPVLENVLRFPRVVKEHAVDHWMNALFNHYAVWPGSFHNAAAGYAYVGFVTYACAWIALLFRGAWRRIAIPLGIALWFIAITLGNRHGWAPYDLIHSLPLYRSLRNPGLYTYTAALFIVIVGTIGFDEIARWLPRSRLRALVLLLPLVVAGSAVDQALQGRKYLVGTFTVEPPPRIQLADAFHQARGNRFYQQLWPYADVGSLSCYDETPWPTSAALRPDLPAEEYLAEPAAGSVRRMAWSPNRIDLEVSIDRPTVVLVNQNWDQGWRASTGEVVAHDGLLGVSLPSGRHQLRLRYWPRSAPAAGALLLATIAITFAAWRRERRRS